MSDLQYMQEVIEARRMGLTRDEMLKMEGTPIDDRPCKPAQVGPLPTPKVNPNCIVMVDGVPVGITETSCKVNLKRVKKHYKLPGKVEIQCKSDPMVARHPSIDFDNLPALVA